MHCPTPLRKGVGKPHFVAQRNRHSGPELAEAGPDSAEIPRYRHPQRSKSAHTLPVPMLAKFPPSLAELADAARTPTLELVTEYRACERSQTVAQRGSRAPRGVRNSSSVTQRSSMIITPSRGLGRGPFVRRPNLGPCESQVSNSGGAQALVAAPRDDRPALLAPGARQARSALSCVF